MAADATPPAQVVACRPRRIRLAPPAEPVDVALPVLSCPTGHELERAKVTPEVVAAFGVTSCDACGKRARVGVHSLHCEEC
eukprot:4376857-Alexandrium_andersonii.AAC.1